MKSSIGYAFDYLMGIMVFGLIYGILNLIFVQLQVMKSAGDLLSYVNTMWWGAVIVYIVFGFFWLPAKIKEGQFYER